MSAAEAVPWGFVDWEEPDAPDVPVRVLMVPGSLALPLLRAWWRWDRWCRAMTKVDEKTGRMPYPTRVSGEAQSAAFEEALLAFAEWAGLDSTFLRERLAELSRMAGPPPLIGFDIRVSVRLDPDVMREQLAAICGHT